MSADNEKRQDLRKPRWLKRRIPAGVKHEEIRRLLQMSQLHTVCQEALCPNLWECFSRGTATFLILGDHCTRNCHFCAIAQGPLGPPDPEEPRRVAQAVREMGIRFVVVTSVTRDDLPDGGAGHFAQTITELRRAVPHSRVEVLVPDFQGSETALKTVVEARPDVLNHNLETISRLYPAVRPQADYQRSLHLLKRVRELSPGLPTKSGLMLGLGESPEELRRSFSDLVEVGCLMLTLGQYLRPSGDHLEVAHAGKGLTDAHGMRATELRRCPGRTNQVGRPVQ